MKFLTKTITIFIEAGILVLSIVWYIKTKELEPLIAIWSSVGVLILSILAKFTIRPRIVLHHNQTSLGRSPRGYTKNNPPIIMVGIDNPEQYWELYWNYNLELRNNSSITAYNVEIKYINLPDKTFIEGEIGKIEPIQSHELRNFEIKIIQNVTGTYIDAAKYMNENANKLTEKFTIELKYSDESGFKFRTQYKWRTDKNKFLVY